MILIVDDDPSFLQEAGEHLSGPRGVFFARDALHAKSLMSSVGSAFSVVLVDLDLPGQDGFSLIREMHQSFPGLPLIAISGVFQEDVLQSARLIGAREALHKPITAEWQQAIERARAGANNS